MLLAERFARDLEALADLPSMPPAVARLLGTLRRVDVSLAEVADIVRADPGLAAQILRVANSLAYAPKVPVATIRDALLRLGLKEVRRLALVVSVYDSFKRPPTGIEPDAFWRHSLGVAHAAYEIARRAEGQFADPGPGGEETLFLAGLVHDLGLLAMATYYSAEYAAARRHAELSGMPLHTAEMEILGTDHGELGALLAQRWGLPAQMVAAIRAHHRPEQEEPEQRGSARVLALAEVVCRTAGVGDIGEGVRPLAAGEGAPHLGLDAGSLEEVVALAREETHRAAALLKTVGQRG